MQAAGLVEFAGAGGAEELPGTAAAILADSAVGGRDKSDCHFTEYDRKPGIKWLSSTGK